MSDWEDEMEKVTNLKNEIFPKKKFAFSSKFQKKKEIVKPKEMTLTRPKAVNNKKGEITKFQTFFLIA